MELAAPGWTVENDGSSGFALKSQETNAHIVFNS